MSTNLQRIDLCRERLKMDQYNDRLVLGKCDTFLDKKQQSYVNFEEEFLRRKYRTYLNNASCETDMHYFFETNPIVLPGLYDLHNGPVGDVIISKLQLSNEYETDFAFISENSANAQITLIEIESPKIKIFRESDDMFTSNFNKALQQVRDWSLWVTQNSTYMKKIFREVYFRDVFRYQRVAPRVILVAGRRTEIQKNPRREKRWSGINQEVEPNVVMSYDRLAETLFLNHRLLQKLICRPRRYISQFIRSRAKVHY